MPPHLPEPKRQRRRSGKALNESHCFSVFGLTVLSELPMRDVFGDSASDRAPDVTVHFGQVPIGAAPSPGYSATDDGTLLYVREVGRFLIREGREIIIEADPAGSLRNVRLFLLGSAFGALLHQRGLLPLHANAIEVDGRAVAFAGHSGAGKSTLAAWFHDRGHRILADDVCVVGVDATGTPLAYPGIPRLRLWRQALEASGRSVENYQRSFDRMDKYDVPTLHEQAAAPLVLDRIYLLGKAGEGSGGPRAERLVGVAAVQALVANTYRGTYVQTIQRTGQHLMACVELARIVPVFVAERVWGLDGFDEQAGFLASHACQRAAG